LLDCNAAAAAAGGDGDSAAVCSDELLTSASLSAEYQQISTWCWVNIRVSYNRLLAVVTALHAVI